MKRVRVLIVDDSALMRKLLSKILESSTDIEVARPEARVLYARYVGGAER